MGVAENELPPSKKRAAGREISRDNPGLDDEEDSAEQETGTFQRASDEVLATRRIVKVRRRETTSTTSTNPFAAIRLVPPAEPTTVTTAEEVSGEKIPEEGKPNSSEDAEKGKDDNHKQPEVQASAEDQEGVAKLAASSGTPAERESTKTENEKLTEDNEAQDEEEAGSNKVEGQEKEGQTSENADPAVAGKAVSSFQQLSCSQNAFTGLVGTGFSTSTFSFGSVSKDGSAAGTSPAFGFGLSNNGSSLFSATGTSITSKSEGSSFPLKEDVTVKTGEENDKVVFTADSVLFEFFDGVWKERGKGELKINVSTAETEQARLVMRARGNYRLILNARLYPDIKLANMDKRGVSFACVNSTSDAKDGLSTYALKFKDVSVLEDFRAAVTTHKGKSTAVKTPENSRKAAEE